MNQTEWSCYVSEYCTSEFGDIQASGPLSCLRVAPGRSLVVKLVKFLVSQVQGFLTVSRTTVLARLLVGGVHESLKRSLVQRGARLAES